MNQQIDRQFPSKNLASKGATRRSVISLAARGLGFAATAGLLGTPIANAQTNLATAPLKDGTALAEVWRAASRFGYGLTPELLSAIQNQGAQHWALAQLSLAQPGAMPVGLVEGSDFLRPLPVLFEILRAAREQRRKVEPDLNPKAEAANKKDAPVAVQAMRQLADQVNTWRLSSSSRPDLENPLLARLTEFWFNHLNVNAGADAVRPFVGHYLVKVIRANCLGQFEDMLLASARHPAMLFYLNQTQSEAERIDKNGNAKGLNENYARELMELHTLGVAGGYSQTDVRELARVLTGWGVDPRHATGFKFKREKHDVGQKVVLGHTFGLGGEQQGIDAIRMLARHPSTAQRISLRLAQFFVSDQPPAGLVRRLQQKYLDTQGNLKALMQTLIASPETWDPANPLFKTPFDFACSALTALGGANDAQAVQQTVSFLKNAGQPLLSWQTPDGYAFDKARWMSPEALTRRADYAIGLGRRRATTDFLLPFFSDRTQRVIATETGPTRNGLILSSPEFMSK